MLDIEIESRDLELVASEDRKGRVHNSGARPGTMNSLILLRRAEVHFQHYDARVQGHSGSELEGGMVELRNLRRSIASDLDVTKTAVLSYERIHRFLAKELRSAVGRLELSVGAASFIAYFPKPAQRIVAKAYVRRQITSKDLKEFHSIILKQPARLRGLFEEQGVIWPTHLNARGEEITPSL